jgi:hypothetical protein
MPVCTSLDIEDIDFLATLKLPLICELSVPFSDPESILKWEEDIAVNANLSGLRLLHVCELVFGINLIQILRSVPVLDTLIVENGAGLDADFFKALVPHQTSGPRESHDATQIPPVLCPMLRSLRVEQDDPTWCPKLMHVLREVVTSRAVVGSPLKTFTFLEFRPKPGSKFEVIGGDGSLIMKKKVLDENDKPFRLDI